jgi:hypothetical protein
MEVKIIILSLSYEWIIYIHSLNDGTILRIFETKMFRGFLDLISRVRWKRKAYVHTGETSDLKASLNILDGN